MFGNLRIEFCFFWLLGNEVFDCLMMDFIKFVDVEFLSLTSELYFRMMEWVDMIKLWFLLLSFS